MLIRDILLERSSSETLAVFYAGKQYTYRALYELSSGVAEKLRASGRATRNIGIYLPNSIEYVIAYFALALLGRTIVPIGIQAKKIEILSTAEYCELGLIITKGKYKNDLCESLESNPYRVGVYDIEFDTTIALGAVVERYQGYSNTFEPVEDDTAILLHTSGTTSNPKRVMLTHANLISNIRSNIESLELTKEERSLIALPMFFGYCNTAQFLTHMFLGASIVIMDSPIFLPHIFFEFIERHKITNFTGVPSMLLMLLSYRNRGMHDVTALRYICFGGGVMPIDKLKELIFAFPTVGFVHTYGQTEASPRATALLPRDALHKIGSVGKPIPGVALRIIDDEGNDVVKGEIGEIILHGPNVMKGYYKRPDVTSTAIIDGWLHTGDLGRHDVDNYVYLTGRKKNIIISGGMNIYPEEIEEVLLGHEGVQEACVIGEEHPILGEVPSAIIVLSKCEKHVSVEMLKDFCMSILPQNKVPVRFTIATELSKTATGKIRRY